MNIDQVPVAVAVQALCDLTPVPGASKAPKTLREVAAYMRVPFSSLRKWLRTNKLALRAAGGDVGHERGRPPLLTPEEQEQLKETVENDSGAWTAQQLLSAMNAMVRARPHLPLVRHHLRPEAASIMGAP